MPSTLTPSQRLAEIILRQPLHEYVAAKRTATPRWSWELIAEQLAADTDGQVAISREALRRWYGEAAA